MANASYEPTLCCMRRLLAVFISSENWIAVEN